MRSGRLSCTMIVDASLAGPHVGYAIGRSFGSAVSRNRMKRRLRALVNAQHHGFPPGYFVIGASPKAAGLGFQDLAGEVAQIVRLCKDKANLQ